MIRLARCIVVAVFAVLSTPLQAAPATEGSVRELMELSGAGALGAQAFQQMLPQLKTMAPSAPDSFWEEMSAEVKPDDLVDLIVPIYQEHFTEEEIQGLIAFYQSPVGKKFVEKLPLITQQSMAAGQQWGAKIAQQVLEKARAAEAE